MTGIRVTSTCDVPLEVLRDLQEELRPEIDLQVDESQVALFSTEPPSWVTFLADSDWWIKALGACALLYVAEIVKEAGRDTWKNRAKALAVVKATGSRIKKLADGILKAKARLRSTTRVAIGVPLPDETWGCYFTSCASNSGELAAEIAIFVHHLPGLVRLIENEHLCPDRVIGPITLSILPNGSLEILWLDGALLEEIHRVLPLPDICPSE